MHTAQYKYVRILSNNYYMVTFSQFSQTCSLNIMILQISSSVRIWRSYALLPAYIKPPSRVLFLAMYTCRRIWKEQRYELREERENCMFLERTILVYGIVLWWAAEFSDMLILIYVLFWSSSSVRWNCFAVFSVAIYCEHEYEGFVGLCLFIFILYVWLVCGAPLSTVLTTGQG